MNGHEVRNVRFSGPWGYEASQVNDLLERMATELDAGRPAGPLIAAARFKMPSSIFSRSGYDPSDVARSSADPWRDLDADPFRIHREPGDPAARIARASKQECEDAWRDFSQQPGTRLTWVRTGPGRRELRTTDLQTVVSYRGWFDTFLGGGTGTFHAGGRTYTLKKVTRSSWPGIPEHNLRPLGDDRPGYQLLDEAGVPVLYMGGQQRWPYIGSLVSGGCGSRSGTPSRRTRS